MKDDLRYISQCLSEVNPESFYRFKNKKTLLIGSNGFLGSWFKDYFQYEGIDFLGFDISDGNDICDTIKLPKYDYVINCAGIASPEKYVKHPIETLDVSYVGTKNVLDYCVSNNVESVILFSSSEVYGTPDSENIPTKESYVGTIDANGSRSCYDIGKQVLETLSYNYFNLYKIPIKVIRPFNFYGPHIGLTDNRVVSNWIRSYNNGDDICVYGSGNQTRTFCYAADGIAMILGAMLNGKNGEIYNVGNPSPELSLIEFAKSFCKYTNYDKLKVIDYPDGYPSEEPLRRCPDINKIIKDVKIEPKISLSEGLSKTINFYKNK